MAYYNVIKLVEETKLIKRVLEGDKSAFKNLYAVHQKFHFLTCRRYIQSAEDAKDVLQEAYIEIYRSLSRYDQSKSSYKTWSNRIVINRCLMHIRKFHNSMFLLNVVDLIKGPSIKPTVETNLNLEDLTKLIATLPVGYRTVFNMFVVDGYSHKEIADQLNISINTSKSQLSKAKKALREICGDFEQSAMVYVS